MNRINRIKREKDVDIFLHPYIIFQIPRQEWNQVTFVVLTTTIIENFAMNTANS